MPYAFLLILHGAILHCPILITLKSKRVLLLTSIETKPYKNVMPEEKLRTNGSGRFNQQCW